MANHLAMAAILEPGDEVLIEHPAYGLIVDAALYLGANVKRFIRTEESGFSVDPAEIRRVLTPRTRLIVLKNLHNPSSAFTPDAVLCDVNLPDGNGLALAGELRPLRVLLTSSDADAAPRRLLARAKAGFVAKPDFLVTDLRPLLG